MSFVQDAINEYFKRIQHYAKVSWEEFPDIKQRKNLSREEIKRKEGALILGKLNAGDQLVLLDERGKSFGSVKFAEWLAHQMMHAGKDVVFVIGGAYGFSDEVYSRSNSKLSLSKMTFSHQVVRALFAEQLYRAFTIQRGEPYHHA